MPQRPSSTWAVCWLCAFTIACGDDDSSGGNAGTGGSGGKGGGTAAGSGGGASGNGSTSSSELPPDFEGIPSLAFGAPPGNCTQPGSNRSDTYVFTLTESSNVLVLTSKDGELQVNDVPCTGVADPVNIEIVGSTATDTVVIDWSWGEIPTSLRAGTISFDGGDSADTLAIAVTRGADNVKLGTADDAAHLDFGANLPKIVSKQQEKLIVSTGPGEDRVEATGGGDLGATLAVAVTVYTGADNDFIQGGAGDDELHAGVGDDVFQTADSADGADVYDGAAGIDSLSYDNRSAAVSITIDGMANDGAADEGDSVDNSVETLIGGSGSDTISAGPAANTLVGGPGDDTLFGGDGDDLFLETGSVQGKDLINGGAGSDTIDYSQRDADLSITLCVAPDAACSGACDCASDDGAAGEADTLVNIENAYGGTGNDKFTGSPAGNTFFGNDGNDELHGEAGNDVLYGDAGDDKLFGGPGEDTLYSGEGSNSCDAGEGQGDICICDPSTSNIGCELS